MSGVISYNNETPTELPESVRSIIKRFRDNIVARGVVSKNDLLVIGKYLEDDLPTGIINSVTSQPSRLGFDKVVNYLDSITSDYTAVIVNVEYLLEYFKIYYNDVVLKTDYERVSDLLLKEINVVSDLYLPRDLRCGSDVTRLGELKIGYMLDNENIIKTYRDSSNFVDYASRNKTYSYGSINVIIAICDFLKYSNQELNFDSAIRYTGTISEYLLDQHKSVTNMVKYDTPTMKDIEIEISKTIYHTPSWVDDTSILSRSKCLRALDILKTDRLPHDI